MKDADIRTILRREFKQKYGNADAIILEEFGVKHGMARLDMVVLNHRMHGFEIKSDLDSLRRLPHQIEVFSSVVDRMTLVVGYRHAGCALRMVPDWWGVRLAEEDPQKGGVVLADARLPRNNPSIDANSLVALLWRDEALDMLEKIGAAHGVRSQSRAAIYQRLVEVSESKDLRDRITRQLKCRKAWPVAEPPLSYDD